MPEDPKVHSGMRGTMSASDKTKPGPGVAEATCCEHCHHDLELHDLNGCSAANCPCKEVGKHNVFEVPPLKTKTKEGEKPVDDPKPVNKPGDADPKKAEMDLLRENLKESPSGVKNPIEPPDYSGTEGKVGKEEKDEKPKPKEDDDHPVSRPGIKRP